MKPTVSCFITFVLLIISSMASAEEPAFCGELVKMAYTKLPELVAEQRRATKEVAIKKTISGDLIFFKGDRWGCSDGISGVVTNVGKGFIVFVNGVGEPREHVLLFPEKQYGGNFWYQLGAEIRTFEPETDPPRPGDKGYKNPTGSAS